MASTLDGGGTNDRVINKGHGTDALGPSDTTDTGSDLSGGPGLIEGDAMGLDRGTNEDLDLAKIGNAGADIGDPKLESDSDSVGTSERRTADRDSEQPGHRHGVC